MSGLANGRASAPGLGWLSIVRLGLVQTALGAVVILTTSTLNRVMVVELALAAAIPGALVGWHYAIQLSRPRWGHGSDQTGRRTPWILAGMAALSVGGLLAATGTALASVSVWGGIALAFLAFTIIGAGVGAAGTSLLALMAAGVAPGRRAAAASIAWIMMIVGFVVTAGTVGALLDPFSYQRLVAVAADVCVIAFIISALAIAGVERAVERQAPSQRDVEPEAPTPFKTALRQVLAEPAARRFAVFVFVSMLAYSMQDLILEPFGGLVFGLSPGQSTQLAGIQNAGVLLGMIFIAVAASASGARFGSRQSWAAAGCIGSALALVGLVFAARIGAGWPLAANVFALGLANGVFAVAAIGAMMGLAGDGRARREGVRVGVWGAAQAIAFGLGGFIGAASLDAARALFGDPQVAFAAVFAVEASLFILAAGLAARIGRAHASGATPSLSAVEGSSP